VLYRVKVQAAAASQQAASSKAQHRVLAATPANLCGVFAQGFVYTFWDAEKSQNRDWTGDCGTDGLDSLFAGASQDKFKKVCSLTGPATSTSCGEKGFLGYLKKFAEPLMGMGTEQCR
jgi:hypothetical protein